MHYIVVVIMTVLILLGLSGGPRATSDREIAKIEARIAALESAEHDCSALTLRQ